MNEKLNPQVDNYLEDGCMRCPYGGTPKCKVRFWTDELNLLRQIVLACGLTEEVKWGVPCYTINGKNVLIVSAFKDYASISFFKGAQLTDHNKILQKQGAHSQLGRIIKFTNVKEIEDIESIIKSYVLEAIHIEKSGMPTPEKKALEPLPIELQEEFHNDPAFKEAFHNLTSGRQRGYIIYFSQPKQSQTRINRIQKYKTAIFKGTGLHDKYNS